MSSAYELVSPFALEQPSPVSFCVQRELESWMDTLGRLPARVRDALLTGAAPLAVRTLIAGGAQDENWLTDLVFHARHPELHGRAIRPGERALAAEWSKIRTELVHPLLQAARTMAAAPPVAPPRRTVAEWLRRALQSAGIDPAKWKPDNGFPSNQPILVLAYDYYAGLFGRNENLLWAGMAKLAGGQVYGGLLEAQGFIDVAARQRMSFAGPDLALELMAGQAHQLQTILLQMQKAIFEDLAWQHQAFMEGGLAALEAAGSNAPMDAWRNIASGDPGRVRTGNRMLLLREQQVIVAPGYQAIRDMKDFDQIPAQMSEKAQSPIPDGKAFRVVVPDGDITLFPTGGNGSTPTCSRRTRSSRRNAADS